MADVLGHVELVCFAAEYRGVEDITVPPAGCLYVGDALKKSNFSVRIHHISSHEIEKTVQRIVASQPLFIGFSVITGSPVAHSARMSRLIKRRDGEIPIVWGGIHPSLMPQACLCEDSVDFVIRGEGEVTVAEFAEALREGHSLEAVAGLCWKGSDGQIHINPERPFIKDLDQCAQDWSLVDPLRYVRNGFDGVKYISLITSRGCPHKCGFCYNLAFNKRRWRAHSVDFVVNAVEKIRQLTGIESVAFNDDNFLVNESRAFGILERLREIGVRVSWLEVRLDRMDENVLQRLSEYGVRTLFVGWESGSDRTLKQIDKGFDTSLILEGFRLAAKYGFNVDASAIVGFPFEDEKDWQATIAMAVRIDELNPGRNKFNIGVYVPYPGTPIVEVAKQHGFEFPQDIMAWDSFDILKGSMRLPWISSSEVRRFAIIDRYAKMLFTGGDATGRMTLMRKAFAGLARLRLRHNVTVFPVEAALYNQMVRFYLKCRMASSTSPGAQAGAISRQPTT